MPQPPYPIDAVITWVDGSDPNHAAKLHRALAGRSQVPSTAKASRFQDSGELNYCVASLLKFAPWIRTIFIVSDQQQPGLMAWVQASDKPERVQVVDHQTLFAGLDVPLPTFNIRSLISVLWRIPGLAERYVFLNDDFVLLQPVAPTDFFYQDDMVVRGQWSVQPIWRRWLRAGHDAGRPGNRAAQARGAVQAGFSWRYWRVPHNPHPQFKSMLARWFAEHPEQLLDNSRHVFRSDAQFLADALCTHLAWRAKRVRVDRKLRTQRLLLNQYNLAQWQQRAAQSARFAFMCLQNLESAQPQVRSAVLALLQQRVGSLQDLLRGRV